MNFIENLKVKQKLLVMFTVLMAALFAVGVIGYYFLNKTNTSLHKMYAENLISVELINENMSAAHRIESDMHALMVTTDENENQELLNDINVNAKKFDSNLTKYEQLPLSDSVRSQLQEIKKDLAQYRSVRQRVLALATQNKNQEAYTLFHAEGKSISQKFMSELSSLSKDINKSADTMNQQNNVDFAFANKLFIGIILVGLLLGFSLGWLIIKQISTRMKQVVDFLNILASGDFSQPVPEHSMQDNSEFGEVSRTVDAMQKSIVNLLHKVATLAEQLAASSEQLSASAEQSAQASNQVAGSVTHVATSAEKQASLTSNADTLVQRIASAMNTVANNTQTVAGSAEKTTSMANDGEDAVKKAVDQMKIIENKTNDTAAVINDLEEKSQQISQIVDVISDISGQTNLLALNAAIEAARAGEAGKGFAVVAGEVGKLAEQSQDAAKQINTLITQIQGKTTNAVNFMNDSKNEVNTGAAVISDTGSTFEQIIHMIKDMSNQIREIAASIQEVSGHTVSIVSAVRDIDDESKKATEETQTISAATEEQSASIEEIASSSQHLAQMADELQQAINTFKL